jgi:hypothetical protein
LSPTTFSRTKDFADRSMYTAGPMDLLIGDEAGYYSRWSTVRLDQLTPVELTHLVSVKGDLQKSLGLEVLQSALIASSSSLSMSSSVSSAFSGALSSAAGTSTSSSGGGSGGGSSVSTSTAKSTFSAHSSAAGSFFNKLLSGSRSAVASSSTSSAVDNNSNNSSSGSNSGSGVASSTALAETSSHAPSASSSGRHLDYQESASVLAARTQEIEELGNDDTTEEFY